MSLNGAPLPSPYQALVVELSAQRDLMSSRCAALAIKLATAEDTIAKLRQALAAASVRSDKPDAAE